MNSESNSKNTPEPFKPPSFKPPWWLANTHAQTILSGNGPRNIWISWQCRKIIRDEQELVIETPSGGKLLCYANIPKTPARVLVLVHGWEGSSHSSYILSAARLAMTENHAVYRLNMRDHGPSHHLNRDLFRSTRLNEVAEAVEIIEQRHPQLDICVAGFSLGGNFIVRIAAEQTNKKRQYLAICPVLKPEKTLQVLEHQQAIYHRYFVRKWKRSLLKKLLHYPDIAASEALLEAESLSTMHISFVGHHTPNELPAEYFSEYEISQPELNRIQSPCLLLSSFDDPIIPVEDFLSLENTENVTIRLEKHGGHCGFIDALFKPGWIDRYLIHLMR